MNIERLRIFVAIAEAGSITGATGHVHLTQPAVSQNLKALEEDLGVELFSREGRGLAITQAGRALLPRARFILEEVADVEHDVRRYGTRSLFEVRIGTVDSVATYLFPHVVPSIRDGFPELRLKFYTGRTATLLDRVDGGDLDLVIAAFSGGPSLERTARIGRYDLQFYGVTSLYSHLADVTSEEELQQFPLVQLRSLPGQPTLVRDDTASFAVAGSLATVKSLVMSGFGVGSLLNFMIDEEERATLTRANVPHDPDCGLYLVANPRWAGEPENRLFDALADALAGAYPGA